jgi:glycosyltransferase involved in cell wall biosynthesis
MPADVITVVIPTYNRSALLQRAIASVLQESRVPVRVHVLDNASTDDTAEVLARLATQDARLSYVRNPVNIGGISNYQSALKSINTTYFVPLADDDLLLEGFLFKAYTIMQSDRTLGATLFTTVQLTADGGFQGFWPLNPDIFPAGKLTPAEHMRCWMRYSHHGWSSILWRSEVLAVIGPPYLHPSLPGDVDFQAQVFSVFNVFIVKELGAVYVTHSSQASANISVFELEPWSEIFERLDRTVFSGKIFDENEYLELRQVLWNRYRSEWHRAPAVPITPRQATRLAVSAGFRLGDWPLAFWLAERASLAASSPSFLLALPDPAGSDAPQRIAGGRRALMLKTIEWFRQAFEVRKTLENALAARTEQLGAAEARADIAVAEAAELSRELAILRQRCLAAETGQALS